MRRISVKLSTVLALVALLALSACGNSNNNNANSPAPSAPASQQAGTGGGATKEVTVNAVNWEFSEPEIVANVGDTLKLTLNNESGVHGLEIPDLGV
ncbi:MAG: cytochrome C oxidase subunit II, partial [Cohnella sp.]|nr:cytochrome C oxidase subunit II [Cohnella sp.]